MQAFAAYDILGVKEESSKEVNGVFFFAHLMLNFLKIHTDTHTHTHTHKYTLKELAVAQFPVGRSGTNAVPSFVCGKLFPSCA